MVQVADESTVQEEINGVVSKWTWQEDGKWPNDAQLEDMAGSVERNIYGIRYPSLDQVIKWKRVRTGGKVTEKRSRIKVARDYQLIARDCRMRSTLLPGDHAHTDIAVGPPSLTKRQLPDYPPVIVVAALCASNPTHWLVVC